MSAGARAHTAALHARSLACSVALVVVAVAVCGCDEDVRWSHFASDAPALEGVSAKSGAPFRLRDARGDVVIVTFGYTQCVDLCPFTLEKIDGAYRALRERGDDVDRVRTAYVSIDPARDSIESLRDLLAAHDPHIDGVWIDEAALASTTEAWDVIAKKHGANLRRAVTAKPDADDYSFDHTATIFVVDAAGKLRARINHAATPSTIANVIEELLRDVPRANAGVRVVDPIARLNANGTAGAAYFTIVNDGDDDDALLGVTSPNAKRATLHETVVDGDVMSMRAIASLPIGKRARVPFEPGKAHVMLSEIELPPNAARMPLTLRFAKRGEVHVEAEVHR